MFTLRSCLWELTLKCSLNCLHCGSTAGKARDRELTLDECFSVAADIVGLGCEEITFIGGEVFLYPGWEELARYFSGHGLFVNIMTNAYQVGEKEIDQIRYAGLSNVGISIDGMEKSHNRIRGRENAFARVQIAFSLLSQAGIPIAVVTSLMKFNYRDLEPLYEFLAGHNVHLWQLQLVNPMGKMAERRDLIVDPRRIPQITGFIREKNKERRMVVIAADSIGYFDENEPYIRGRRAPVCYWEGCQAGLSGVGLDSVGNVRGCGALYDDTFVEGNVRQRSLLDIWADPDSFSYNRSFDPSLLSGICRDCAVGDVCRGGCRASNYFMKQNLYESAFCRRPKLTPFMS